MNQPTLSPALGQNSLLRIGGSLGVAATAVSLLIFMAGCFGFFAVFKYMPIIPLLLSITGLALSFIGGTLKKSPMDAEPHILFGIFVNFIGLVGAIGEMTVGNNWTMFFPTGGGT